MRVGRSERLVGRERELIALGDWLAETGRGQGGVYVIAGEPGVGKSRLAGEAVALLPASWFVTRGRATDRYRSALSRRPCWPRRGIARCLTTRTSVLSRPSSAI